MVGRRWENPSKIYCTAVRYTLIRHPSLIVAFLWLKDGTASDRRPNPALTGFQKILIRIGPEILMATTDI